MPSLDLTNRTLRYAASDATVLDKAATLLKAMADYDPDAKQDATSAVTYIGHLQKLVAKKRTPAIKPDADDNK